MKNEVISELRLNPDYLTYLRVDSLACGQIKVFILVTRPGSSTNDFILTETHLTFEMSVEAALKVLFEWS